MASESRHYVAICCNGKMLPGLHATLGSLVRSLGPGRRHVVLTLFWQGLSVQERDALTGTIRDAGGVGELALREADTTSFDDLPGLHGDRMTYVRLLLPQLLPEAEIILYLDSDLIINTDVTELLRQDLGPHPIGAVEGTSVVLSFDHAFLRHFGLQDEDRYFNCGVLLINAVQWRREGVSQRALALAREHASRLTSHDQSVLVALFSRDFARLPRRFNRGVSPLRESIPGEDCIVHFVGSPKPWDPFGRLVHGNWRLWANAVARTQYARPAFLFRRFADTLRRIWSLRRSYVRTLTRRRRRHAEESASVID